MTATDATPVPVDHIAPLGHDEAQDLFAAEADRTLELLRSLSRGDWTTPTDCPDWDVRAMYLHVLGACESGASMKELAHQMRAAKRRQKREGGPLEAALSATQVAEREALTPTELVERLAAVAPRTVKRRRGMPGLVRRIRMGVDGPVVEKWSLGYLNDTIYLRDAWMHRIDTCRAVGLAPVLSSEHDRRIVADVVAEWARRHGRSFDLTLIGPAGGRFQARVADDTAVPEAHTLDAVELCRILAGRAPGEGLLATIVPF
jgi:uncharacterized protein (TIGR03083 family)